MVDRLLNRARIEAGHFWCRSKVAWRYSLRRTKNFLVLLVAPAAAVESLSPSSIWFMKIKDLRVALFGAWTNRFSRSTKIPLFASTSPLFVTACGEFVLCPEPVEGSKIWGGQTVMINIFLFLLLLLFSILAKSRGGICYHRPCMIS